MNNPTEDEKKAVAKERQREWQRQYNQRPEVKDRKREYSRKYYSGESGRTRKYYPGKRDRTRELERLRDRKYGLSPGQWDAEYARLRGICPICVERMTRPAFGVKATGRTAATDHDHGTKKFRGILCRHCNLKENSDSAKAIAEHKRAIAYHRRAGRDVDAPTQGTLL